MKYVTYILWEKLSRTICCCSKKQESCCRCWRRRIKKSMSNMFYLFYIFILQIPGLLSERNKCVVQTNKTSNYNWCNFKENYNKSAGITIKLEIWSFQDNEVGDYSFVRVKFLFILNSTKTFSIFCSLENIYIKFKT